MSKSLVAGMMVLLMVGGIVGYYAYTNYLPGKVVLSINDSFGGTPPGQSQYSSNISHIYVAFSSIDIHSAGVGNSSSAGWHQAIGAGTIDLMTVLVTSQTLGTAKLLTGKYDLIRMTTSTATVTISGTNYSYNIPSGRIQFVITGGGFQITVGQIVNVLLTLSFNENEIMTHGPNLNPIVKASIVP